MKHNFNKSTERREDPTKNLIYVVPSVQGCDMLLEDLLAAIKTRQTLASNDTILFLGNLVGMGGNNRRVLNLVRQFQTDMDINVVALTGPNEYRFINLREEYMTRPLFVEVMSDHMETYNGYGNHINVVGQAPRYRIDNADIHKNRIWLNSLNAFYMTKKFFFCPSGVNLAKDTLKDQKMGELMFNPSWDTFGASTKDYGKKIIHTIPKTPTPTATQMGIYDDPTVTGILSCVVLNDTTGEKEEEFFVKKTKAVPV